MKMGRKKQRPLFSSSRCVRAQVQDYILQWLDRGGGWQLYRRMSVKSFAATNGGNKKNEQFFWGVGLARNFWAKP